MLLQVQVFAALKEHFEPQFELDVGESCSASELLERLARERPGAAELLRSCRVAMGDSILSEEGALRGGEHIAVLPPFSGG